MNPVTLCETDFPEWTFDVGDPDVAQHECPVCGERVNSHEWSDAWTQCRKHLMPTQVIEERADELAMSAAFAYEYRSEL